MRGRHTARSRVHGGRHERKGIHPARREPRRRPRDRRASSRTSLATSASPRTATRIRRCSNGTSSGRGPTRRRSSLRPASERHRVRALLPQLLDLADAARPLSRGSLRQARAPRAGRRQGAPRAPRSDRRLARLRPDGMERPDVERARDRLLQLSRGRVAWTTGGPTGSRVTPWRHSGDNRRFKAPREEIRCRSRSRRRTRSRSSCATRSQGLRRDPAARRRCSSTRPDATVLFDREGRVLLGEPRGPRRGRAEPGERSTALPTRLARSGRTPRPANASSPRARPGA